MPHSVVPDYFGPCFIIQKASRDFSAISEFLVLG